MSHGWALLRGEASGAWGGTAWSRTLLSQTSHHLQWAEQAPERCDRVLAPEQTKGERVLCGKESLQI